MKERCEALTNAQRSQIVWNILSRTGYDSTRKEKVSVGSKPAPLRPKHWPKWPDCHYQWLKYLTKLHFG
jgi:hypothetical protein